MRTQNVGRTKTPAPWGAFGGTKKLVLVSTVLPVVAIAPFAINFLIPPADRDEIEVFIRKAGFEPLIPPTRLNAPGGLYKVVDGRYYKVCPESPLAESRTQKSVTMNYIQRRLEKDGFSLTGDFVDTLNAKLSGARVTMIEYNLTNVAVSEITDAELLEIQSDLLQQKFCGNAVNNLLKENIKVCFANTALSATTSYKIHIDQEIGTEAQVRAEALKAVQKAIHEDVGGHIEIRSDNELTGENLFVGIHLNEQCITPGDATEPILAPPVWPRDKSAALP